MSLNSYTKCLECNTINQNSDYCHNCGALINITLKRKIEHEKKLKKKIEEQKIKPPSKPDIFFKKMSSHPNTFIRLTFEMLYSIWLFFGMVVGGLIALVVGVAAG